MKGETTPHPLYLLVLLPVIFVLFCLHSVNIRQNDIQKKTLIAAYSITHQDFTSVACDYLSDFPGTVILGRPTDSEITFNILSTEPFSQVRIDAEPEHISGTAVLSDIFSIEADQNVIVTLSGLNPNTKYVYTIVHRSGDSVTVCSTMHRFQTQRALGSPFRFAIIADSHLDNQKLHCNATRYQNTLNNIHLEQPDFVLSLGDDFRASILKKPSFAAVEQLFRNQRPYFTTIAQDAALFNIPGNHELQSGWLLDGTENNIPIWAVKSRLAHFPNPRPNDFYSGATRIHPFVPFGLPENYYAWTWGDALLITLDNYLYSEEEKGWGVSLGLEQFTWLKNIVRLDATFKFVFHHHVCGDSRGGIEMADFYEWGGYTAFQGKKDKKIWEFETMRPGWGSQPIHQILVENNVDVVFQGHDHLFSKQVHPDGIVYITVPMPGFDPDNFFGEFNDNSESYESGIVLATSGHISVVVSGQTATIAYILSRIPGDNPENGVNGEVGYTFNIVKFPNNEETYNLS